MRSETEIIKKIDELKEQMKDIKTKAARNVYGKPGYANPLIYGQLLRDSINIYKDITVLFWVLNKPIEPEIDLLTRLNPNEKERI